MKFRIRGIKGKRWKSTEVDVSSWSCLILQSNSGFMRVHYIKVLSE